MIRRVIAGLLGSTLLFAGAHAASYRWTGDDGQVIYSQTPPPDDRPYTVIGAPPPPADAQRDSAALKALRQQQADRAEDQEVAAEKQAAEAEKQAAVEENCAAARRNITTLEGRSRQLTRMPDGTVRRLTPEERDEKLAEARKYLEENCR